MELVAGQSLRKRWKKFPMRAKENLIKQFVGYQVELCRRNLRESGTSVNLKRKRLNLKTGPGSSDTPKLASCDEVPFALE